MNTIYRRPTAQLLLWTSIATGIAFAATSIRRGPVTSQTQSSPDVCVRHLQHLAYALQMYADDYDQHLPPMNTTAQMHGPVSAYILGQSPLDKYSAEEKRTGKEPIFRCPITKLPYEPNPAVSGLRVETNLQAINERPAGGNKLPKSNTVWIFRDAKPHPDGWVTVGYLDGHVQRVKHLPTNRGQLVTPVK